MDFLGKSSSLPPSLLHFGLLMSLQERGLIYVITILKFGWSLPLGFGITVLVSFIHCLVLCLIGIPKAIGYRVAER